MAIEEHLAKLREGVNVWNEWRKNHPDIRPELRGADLSLANLSGADLRHFAMLSDLKNWRSIFSMKLANVQGVIDPPEGFVDWAIEGGAVSVEFDEEWRAMKEEA